jgi:type I restriction enzyme M protein
MTNNNSAAQRIDTPARLNRTIKAICDILRRDKAKGARLYVPELTWMLFLSALDQREMETEQRYAAIWGSDGYRSIISPPYRWRDWAAPYDGRQPCDRARAEQSRGWKRYELDQMALGSFLSFVNGELFPHLKSLGAQPGATEAQKVVSEIFRTKDETVVASETNLQDALDQVDALAHATVDDRHMFPISQAFEGLLPALGEKKNDGGQFFTPREVIRAIVHAVNPRLGRTVYDPCCGTGGFLIEAYRAMLAQGPTATQIDFLRSEALWGREDASEAVPICLANMVLHDIEVPRIWHGNTLTGIGTYEGLFEGSPNQFDYILTNPPFGSKEGKDAQSQFPYKTSKAQVLFLQHIIDSLADDGQCGMVIDEGVLFHTRTAAFRQTKRKLLTECDLWAIVSLPPNVFVNAGAGSKTNLLFFTKGRDTERVWYYDLSDLHITKKKPLTFAHFADFFARLELDVDDPDRVGPRSWWRAVDDIRAIDFDLRAVNPNAPDTQERRSVEELTEVIEESQRAVKEALVALISARAAASQVADLD